MKKLLFFLVCSMFVIKAYSQAGNLDSSFGNNGWVAATQINIIRSIAVQADGKIVVTGAGFGSSDFVVARYNTNGSLDNTFSGDGIQTTDFGSGDTAYSVAVQANGKIIVSGSVLISTDNSGFGLARYNPDGSLDNTFSGDGKLPLTLALILIPKFLTLLRCRLMEKL